MYKSCSTFCLLRPVVARDRQPRAVLTSLAILSVLLVVIVIVTVAACAAHTTTLPTRLAGPLAARLKLTRVTSGTSLVIILGSTLSNA